MDDAELVRATRNADASAFTAIFDRYAARVHDLALAMLRDRGAALEVVESTFLEASLRIQGLDQPHRLPVWLLAVTRRNAALRAGPVAGTDRQPSLPNDDPERVSLASLVWEAVADLPLRERTLIDLDLRQGLDGNDLADALGVTLPQAQHLQARMRDRIEKGLSGYVIAKTAEGRCPDLTKVLKGWDGRFTPKDSGRIARHVEGCKVCNQIRFGLPSPFALYAAALPAPFPAAVRPRVLERVVLPVPAGGSALASTPSGGSTETEAMPYQHPLAPTPSSFATAAPLPQAATASHDATGPVPWLDPFEPPRPPAPPEADSSFAVDASPGFSYPDPAAVQEPTSQLEPAPASYPADPYQPLPPAPAPAPYPADPSTEPYQPLPPTPAPASDPADPPTEPYQPLPPTPAPGPPAAASAPAESVPAPVPAPMPEYDPAPPFHYDPTPMPNHGQVPGADHEPAPMPDRDQATIAEPEPTSMPDRDQAPVAGQDPTPAAEHVQAPAAQPDPAPMPDHGRSLVADHDSAPMPDHVQAFVADHDPAPAAEDVPMSPPEASPVPGPVAAPDPPASPGSDAMPEHAEPVPQPPHPVAPSSEHPGSPPPPSQESP